MIILRIRYLQNKILFEIKLLDLYCFTGKKNYGNIDTVYSAGEFIIFSILLVGCGLWGELIHKTEQRRNLGVFRYPG